MEMKRWRKVVQGSLFILIVVFYFLPINLNTNSTNYLKIIESVFRDNSKNITGAVVLWGKGDIPLMKQLNSNYPLDTNSITFASYKDKPEKYNQIIDLIKEVPKLEKVDSSDADTSDYFIIGANIQWDKRNFVYVAHRFYSIRLYVDKNYNIFLPQHYPYHDNSSKVGMGGNRFIIFHANEKAKGLIDQILKENY